MLTRFGKWSKHEIKMILTIGITTFNRADHLGQTIDYLLKETVSSRKLGKLEIVVINNNSADNTSHLLNQYRKLENVIVAKNVTTLPVYESIFNILKLSSGHYFWCFGDDDLVPHGYIEDLVGFLELRTSALIVSDRQDFFSEDTIDLSPVQINPEYVSFNQLIDEFNHFDRLFGFLTSVIFKREIILSQFSLDPTILENNYANKYVAWKSVFLEGLAHIHGPIAFKRCSIGAGSHFQSNLEIKIKTFLLDQVKIALRLKQVDQKLSAKALKNLLNDYRAFLKYKDEGANLFDLAKTLRSLGLSTQQLLVFNFAALTPLVVIRILKLAAAIKTKIRVINS